MRRTIILEICVILPLCLLILLFMFFDHMITKIGYNRLVTSGVQGTDPQRYLRTARNAGFFRRNGFEQSTKENDRRWKTEGF